MKKNFLIKIGILVVFLICLVVVYNFQTKEKTTLKKIKVAEVTHSVFYAPQYAAIANGYFEDEGLDIDLTLASGADKVIAAVLSGDVDIGFSGIEATIYVYNGGEKDYLKTFAQLTQKDGSFLVSREKYDNFTLEDLKGKYVIGGRPGGMPEMTFEWALKENGINKDDLTIDTSIAFASMQGAFVGGTGDFVTLFEPNALDVEKQGLGYVVASIGELGGVVPYTSYSARTSYIEENPETIEKFNNAVQKGLDFVHNSDSKDVAEAISSFFPDTSIDDLTKVVDRYKEIEAWPKTTDFTEESFNHIQDIMINSNELDEKVPYNDLIYKK